MPTIATRAPLRIAASALLAAALVPLLAACGSDESAADRPTVVVTTTILGSVVEEVVGDAAQVEVLMPDGVDPHDFQPSAKDAAALGDADLVVQNGLDLEEGLEDAIAAARDDGVRIFTATDHVTLRTADEEHAREEGGEEHEDEHGPEDPHIWMDPLAMRDMARALVPVLTRDLGLDLQGRDAEVPAELEALDTELRTSLAVVPTPRRKLVTGHESMGYFADRYDLELIGALIPSLSSQAQVSASNLAGLVTQVEEERVPVIFTEIGTPSGIADALADQAGVGVVEIGSHVLPDDGSYSTFMREVAAAVVGGLTRKD